MKFTDFTHVYVYVQVYSLYKELQSDLMCFIVSLLQFLLKILFPCCDTFINPV